MTRYEYSPLDESKHEIRILTLLPGKDDWPICGTLSTVPFHEVKTRSFEALSYTWGSTADPLDITILSPENTTLPVTQNLSKALHDLRYEDHSRLVWIDAICINQQDLSERSSQVFRMADIFSSAYRVLIWLGPESDDTRLALECVSLIASAITVDWSRRKMHAKEGDEDGHKLLKVQPFNENQYLALKNLFDSDWFQRLWIWQEARLGSSATIVVRGKQHALWQDIRTTIFYLCWMRLPSHIPGIHCQVQKRANGHHLCFM
jgi:hypothetical protein